MQELFEKSELMMHSVNTGFTRYLLKQVRWNNRLIAITGARGCGKTTLLLQYANQLKLSGDEILYVSMDDIILSNRTIVKIAEAFYKKGGKVLLIDEIHKYPRWSKEIKNIYDSYKNIKVVFTGSSVLEIYKGEADLSRRALEYTMHNMSLREYICIKKGIDLPVVTLEDLMKNHKEIAAIINAELRPLKFYSEYLSMGAFPYFSEDAEMYHMRLLNTINLAIETDLTSITAIDYSAVLKLKQLISIIAESVPFKPNILKLSERLGIKRDTLIRYLHLLEKARILALLNSSAKGISKLTKPDKIYLHNTNLMFALVGNTVNTGSLRETFFVNQLLQGHKINYTEKGDFLVDNKYIFEIGGVNKTTKQIKNMKNAFIAMDDIEYGSNNVIPLWLFGFLY